MTTLTKFDFQQMVMEKEGKPITTSLKVAEYFGKRHADVLRKIDTLDCSKDFTLAHFCAYVENTKVGAVNRDSRFYEMDFQGFMFLVMGFTGKKASKIKEAYINAFDWMYEQLNNISKSYMEMMNRLSLQYNQEKSVASFAGRALRKWQTNKPCLVARMKELERSGQGQLLLE